MSAAACPTIPKPRRSSSTATVAGISVRGCSKPAWASTRPGWRDLDGDGRLDILSKPYNWDTPRVDVWLNRGLASASTAGAKDVTIRVDGAKTHQRYEGFGATTLTLVYPGTLGDALGPKLRPLVLDALYGQVRLSMGNISTSLLESPGGWDRRRNDNDDPLRIDWSGFDTFPADHAWRDVVRPGAKLALDNYSLEAKINWAWTSPWLKSIYQHDRQRCLDECAEQIEAMVVYWKKISGGVPRYVHLFNEPTSGNHEIGGADAAMVRDILKRRRRPAPQGRVRQDRLHRAQRGDGPAVARGGRGNPPRPGCPQVRCRGGLSCVSLRFALCFGSEDSGGVGPRPTRSRVDRGPRASAQTCAAATACRYG